MLLAASSGSAAGPVDPLLTAPGPAARQLASWEEAISLWAAQSTELRVSAAEVVRAAGRHRLAVGALLPSVTGSALASFSLLAPPPGSDPGTAALYGAAPYQTLSLVAQLSLIDARTWNAVAAASDAERAAKLSLDDARRLLLLNLAQALLGAVTAERVAELNRAGLAAALERLQLGERANRAGASTELDLSRLLQDTELARAQVVAGDELLLQAREALGAALGLDQPVGVDPRLDLDGLARQATATCRGIDGLEQRADQRAAAARVDLAERAVLDVKAWFLPTLGVRSTAQAFITQDAATGQSAVLPIWNLQAVLTVPIWDGGGRYGALRDAKGQREQAQAQRDATERRGRLDLGRARRGVEVAQHARALAAAALEQAARTDTLTRKAWDAGLGTSLELVTAATSLRAQQLSLALKDYDVLRARVVALFTLADCSP